MTLEDHSGDDDSEPTAEEEAAYEQWKNASKKPESTPVQMIPPMQEGPPIWNPATVRKGVRLSHNEHFWEEMFEDLRVFRQMHGHLRITRENAPSPSLYTWITDQRRRLRLGELSPERQERLNSLGFLWLAPGRIFSSQAEHEEATWQERYGEMRRFIETHGHDQVPMKENPTLSRWIKVQRRKHAHGILTPQRTGLLESIGFRWKGENLGARAEWERRFGQMGEYIREHGHDRITMRTKTVPGLHSWREKQRALFREGKLSPERQARLEAIGFTFAPVDRSASLFPANEELWENRFAALLRFKEQHGHCLIPRKSRGGDTLAGWVHRQRVLFDKGELTAARIERLEAIGFVWKSNLLRDRHKSQWDKHFEELVKFKQEHGHDVVTDSYDHVLSTWRAAQQHRYRHGKLPPERVALLNSIGFGWTASGRDQPLPNAKRKQGWNEKLEQFRAFMGRHGHPRVPLHSKEYPGLGSWVWKQRAWMLNGNLRPERKRLLEEAGFYPWEVAPVNRRPASRPSAASKRGPEPQVDSITMWEQGFAALQAFHGQHGHVDVPDKEPEHRKLAAWLRQQRIGRERGSLLFSQASRLEQLGFRWE